MLSYLAFSSGLQLHRPLWAHSLSRPCPSLPCWRGLIASTWQAVVLGLLPRPQEMSSLAAKWLQRAQSTACQSSCPVLWIQVDGGPWRWPLFRPRYSLQNKKQIKSCALKVNMFIFWKQMPGNWSCATVALTFTFRIILHRITGQSTNSKCCLEKLSLFCEMQIWWLKQSHGSISKALQRATKRVLDQYTNKVNDLLMKWIKCWEFKYG